MPALFMSMYACPSLGRGEMQAIFMHHSLQNILHSTGSLLITMQVTLDIRMRKIIQSSANADIMLRNYHLPAKKAMLRHIT